jgi:hypothetical protein
MCVDVAGSFDSIGLWRWYMTHWQNLVSLALVYRKNFLRKHDVSGAASASVIR